MMISGHVCLRHPYLVFQLHHDQSSTLHHISFFPKMFLFDIIFVFKTFFSSDGFF